MRTVGSFAILRDVEGGGFYSQNSPSLLAIWMREGWSCPVLGGLLYPLWISRGSTFRSQGPDHW